MEKSNTSQVAKILNYLQSGRSLTPIAALKLFGCFRLASRIYEIRKTHKVVNIGEGRGGKIFAKYVLEK